QPEERVRRDVDVEIEIPGAVRARGALALQADALAAAHALRHLHGDRASRVRLGIAQRDRTAAAVRRFLERQRPAGLMIGPDHRCAASARAGTRCRPTSSARTAALRATAHAEQLLEEIAEVAEVTELERFAGVAWLVAKRIEAWRRCAMRLRIFPRRAVAIVALALGRILQHLVRLAELLEFLLGVLGLVDVGVVFPRQLPIGAIDLVACGSPRNAEQGIIVDELHAGGAPGQSRLAAFPQDTDCG